MGELVEVMYVPKKLKWETLGSFKKFLETETTEKVVSYNGHELITETTEYGIVDSQLNCRPISEKKPVLKQEPVIRRKLPVSETTTKKSSKIKKKPIIEEKSRQQVIEEMKARGKQALESKKSKVRKSKK